MKLKFSNKTTMENKKRDYVELCNLDVYKLAREHSVLVWEIYKTLDWQMKKIMGDQAVRSTDSVGANIAEGYGRFHYGDKNKFYYNARGSLLESRHWLELFYERGFIDKEKFKKTIGLSEQILIKLNGLIKSQLDRKKTATRNQKFETGD